MPIALDGGQAISLGGARGGSWYSFFFVVPPFWIVFLDCFFLAFFFFSFCPGGKKKRVTTSRRGHPLDWLLAPIKGNRHCLKLWLGSPCWILGVLVAAWQQATQQTVDFESKWYQRAAAIREKHKVSLSFKPCAVYCCLFCLLYFYCYCFLFLFFLFPFFCLFFFIILIMFHFPMNEGLSTS